MVDAEGCLFLEDAAEGHVEGVGGAEVCAEGFFDDDALPWHGGGVECAPAFAFGDEAGDADVVDDRFVEVWGDREVEEDVW